MNLAVCIASFKALRTREYPEPERSLARILGLVLLLYGLFIIGSITSSTPLVVMVIVILMALVLFVLGSLHLMVKGKKRIG